MYSGCYGPDRASVVFYIVAILYNSLIQFLNESIFKSLRFCGGKFGRAPPLLYPRSSFRFLLSVCPCVCDGCGRGRNEFTEMAIIILEIGKAAAGWTLCVAGYAKDAIMGACHRTSDEQEHKFIWHAGPERDTIFHLHVTAC